MVERQAENLEVVRSIRPVGILIFQFNNLLDEGTFDISNFYLDDDLDLNTLHPSNCMSDQHVREIYIPTDCLLVKKSLFFNLHNNFKKVAIIRKTVFGKLGSKKYFTSIRSFFQRMPFNKTSKQRSSTFFTYLILYFLITHDLYFFSKKLTVFLQKTDRRFQFKIVRQFRLFNQFAKSGLFNYFCVSGLYFRVSGKFGGVGGSKKLRKTMVWARPGFSDRSIKLQRTIDTV